MLGIYDDYGTKDLTPHQIETAFKRVTQGFFNLAMLEDDGRGGKEAKEIRMTILRVLQDAYEAAK